MQPNYAEFIQRILDILKSDQNLAEKIKEFRFGDLPNIPDGTEFPLLFVSAAKSPEVSRTVFTPQGDINKLPGQKLVLEFWAVLVVARQTTPGKVQQELYDLTAMIQTILAKNNQLRSNGDDPLCATFEMYTQGRLEQQRGKLLEAMTIRIRPTIFLNTVQAKT